MRYTASILASVLLSLFVILSASAAEICFEAELANELSLPFEIAEREGASGGRAIHIPEGAGCGIVHRGIGGAARCRFSVPEEGSYSVWLRVWCNGVCSNSIFVGVGDTPPRKVQSDITKRWNWVCAGTWKLQKGDSDVLLVNREDGLWVDQIFVTSGKTGVKDEIREPNIIPGVPGRERAEPRLFFGALAGESDLLPAVDFKLTHDPILTFPLESVRTVVVDPANPHEVVLWLRNNALKEASGSIELSTDAPVVIKPSAVQSFKFGEGEAVQRIRFEISARQQMPRRTYRMYVRLTHDSGVREGQQIVLIRPFQWLVTNEFICPETVGIDVRNAIDGNAGKGFPGTAKGVQWRLAPESAITPFGLVNMRRAVADKTYAMAYAYTAIDSPQEGEYILQVRHDDMIRVWLNGIPVLTGLQSAPSDTTMKRIKVRLKKGNNHLLVKLTQRKNYWEFGVQLLVRGGGPALISGGPVEHLLGEAE